MEACFIEKIALILIDLRSTFAERIYPHVQIQHLAEGLNYTPGLFAIQPNADEARRVGDET